MTKLNTPEQDKTDLNGNSARQKPVVPVVKDSFGWPRAFAYVFMTATVAFIIWLNSGVAMVRNFISHEELKPKWQSYIHSVEGQNSLQVAKIETFQRFSHIAERKLVKYFDRSIEVSVEAPSEIVYYVPLKNAQWEFFVSDDGRRLYVIAPQIEFNTPAISIKDLKFTIEKSRIFGDVEAAQEELRDQLPDLLAEGAREQIPSVRDTARRQVKEFVRNWFASDRYFADAVIDDVYFSDEREEFLKKLKDVQQTETLRL